MTTPSKRVVDVIGAVTLVIASSPLMLAIAVMVRVRLGSPVFFRQVRAGRHGERFELVKFRSMTDERGVDGVALPDDMRLTSFGRWLRSTSLDELPELGAVLRGRMSLVGPRPLPAAYLDRYTPEQARRHEVKPGLTGWAQVNGRNATTWDERLSMDVWYVDNQSLWLDLEILLRTIGVVLRRDGISADGEVTMPEFLPPDDS